MLCPRGWLVATERYNWHMNVSDATKAFLESLSSPEAGAFFEKEGFSLKN